MRLPSPPKEYDPKWAMELVNTLERESRISNARAATYDTDTSLSDLREVSSSATLAEVIQVLNTLIKDLQFKNVVK